MAICYYKPLKYDDVKRLKSILISQKFLNQQGVTFSLTNDGVFKEVGTRKADTFFNTAKAFISETLSSRIASTVNIYDGLSIDGFVAEYNNLLLSERDCYKKACADFETRLEELKDKVIYYRYEDEVPIVFIPSENEVVYRKSLKELPKEARESTLYLTQSNLLANPCNAKLLNTIINPYKNITIKSYLNFCYKHLWYKTERAVEFITQHTVDRLLYIENSSTVRCEVFLSVPEEECVRYINRHRDAIVNDCIDKVKKSKRFKNGKVNTENLFADKVVLQQHRLLWVDLKES